LTNKTGGNLRMKTQQALIVLGTALLALLLAACATGPASIPGTGEGELPGAVRVAQNWLAE
jgi:hypothetical protein